MSDSTHLASALSSGSSVRVAQEMSIAPEETLIKLSDVIELAGQVEQFDAAFVEYARGLTGAKAASIFRKTDLGIEMVAASSVSREDAEIPKEAALLVEVSSVIGGANNRRSTIPFRGVKYGVLTTQLSAGQGDEELAVLVLALGPDRAPFASPIFTIEHLLCRIYGERARIGEAELWKEGFLQATILIDLFGRTAGASTMRDAMSMVSEELREMFGASRVALGLGKGARCQVAGLSGAAKIEERSHGVRLLRGLMRESLGLGKPVVWPPPREVDSEWWPATGQGELLEAFAAEQVAAVPLRTTDEEETGAMLLFFPEPKEISGQQHELITSVVPYLASLVELIRLSKPKGIRGFVRRTYTHASKNRKVAIWATLAFFVFLLLVPVPYKVKASCEVQPVQLRQVAAPFDGRLEEVYVKPGVEVEQGDLLATLDGKELSWRLAQAISEKEITLKQRDVAQSEESDPAEAVMAQLEADAAGLEVELLQYQKENLEVKAPADGFVLSGDLEQSKGVPVAMGQKLFDLAPTLEMRLEMSVPDSDIRRVEVGQEIKIRLEAQPREVITATVEEVYPVSEIEDGKNVFIALATLDNENGELRPGMRGKAKISSGIRSLGWVLFHKPIEFVQLHL